MNGADEITRRVVGPTGASTEPGWADPQALVRAAVLSGGSDVMQRLRRQVEVVGPHLRGAVAEAEGGLGGEFLVAELHRRSAGCDRRLVSEDLCGRDALRQLDEADLPQSVMLRGLPGASKEAQRRLARLMRGTALGHNSTRWWVLAGKSVRLMLDEQTLLPELARCLPAVTLRLPPLRERREDIGAVATEMVAKLGAGNRLQVGHEVREMLEMHRWPENLEEMARAFRRWCELDEPSPQQLATLLLHPKERHCMPVVEEAGEDEPILLQRVIDRHLLRILGRCGGNKLRAAEMLGISRSTLYRMLEAVTGGEQRTEAV